MTTAQVANRLVELCRTGAWAQAQEELYAENAESIEPAGTPWESVKGKKAIQEKAAQWFSSVEEVHGSEVSDPLVAGNFFSVRMMNDTTMKGMGRNQFEEICLYEVQDGKVIKEQFFYQPMMP